MAGSSFIFRYLMFFFCKQKTSYEMRISDWSSDVCSSDLLQLQRQARRHALRLRDGALRPAHHRVAALQHALVGHALQHAAEAVELAGPLAEQRSEERRVGKECFRTFRSRWSPCR